MPKVKTNTTLQSSPILDANDFGLGRLQQALSTDLRCLENEARNQAAIGSDMVMGIETLGKQIEALGDKLDTLNANVDRLWESDLVDTLAALVGVLEEMAEQRRQSQVPPGLQPGRIGGLTTNKKPR